MLQQLTSALLTADKLHVQLGGAPMDEESCARLKMWGAGIFRLVVVGEIKKGKSSFINALLGEENLVPTHSDVATSTVFKIHYAEKKLYRVFFRENTGKAPLSINEADLPLFGTENGNPGNEKEVAFIEVGVPSTFLKSGIVIFDTPGLGGLFKEHRRVTYECIPKADAVFFVTDSVDSPLGRLETDYLRDIKDITSHIFFAQTKCCSVDTAARDARRANNLRTIADCLNIEEKKIPYFLLDSHLRFEAEEYKDLDDLKASGYPALLAFVQHELQAKQQQLLAERMLAHTQPLLTELSQKIDSQKQLLAADSEEARRTLKQSVEAKQAELRRWQSEAQPLLLEELQEKLRVLQETAVDECDRNKPMGELHLKLKEQINSAANQDALQAVLQQIEQNLPDAASRCMNEIANRLRSGAEKILRELGHRNKLTELTSYSGAMLQVHTDPLAQAAEDMKDSSLFNTARTGLYGGLAGATIASVAGGIIGSVIPVVGTLIGSLAGTTIAAIWGGHQAVHIQQQQQLKAARAQAENAIAQTIAALYSDMTKTVKRIIDEINRNVRDTVKKFVKERNANLEAELKAIKQRSDMKAAEIAEQQKGLAAAEAQFATINRTIQDILSRAQSAKAS